MAVPPVPVQVPNQWPPPMSVTSVAYNKGDTELKLGAARRSPGIYLMTEENSQKPQLGDRLMKTVLPIIVPNEVSRIAQQVRVGDGSHRLKWSPLRPMTLGSHSTLGLHSIPVVHGAMGCDQKSFKLIRWCHQTPVQVPIQRPLAPRVTSVANDKDDNEMIPRAVHRSPGIYLMVRKAPGNRS